MKLMLMIEKICNCIIANGDQCDVSYPSKQSFKRTANYDAPYRIIKTFWNVVKTIITIDNK